MFAEVEKTKALRILARRQLGYTLIRLLPKETGVRPIMNLKRRGFGLEVNKRTGEIVRQKFLGASINALLTQVLHVLNYEKQRDPAALGSSLFSVSELYPRLKQFKQTLVNKGWQGRRLYLVKADVQSCFDTIDQTRIIDLLDNLLSEDEYILQKYVTVQPKDSSRIGTRYTMKANPADDISAFSTMAANMAQKSRNTVFSSASLMTSCSSLLIEMMLSVSSK
ncbi:Telomerase reverse transcriptase [Saitoella coloradoensis]